MMTLKKVFSMLKLLVCLLLMTQAPLFAQECTLETGSFNDVCLEDGSHKVTITIRGTNGTFVAFDASAVPNTSAPKILGTTSTPAMLELTYPKGVTTYNISIFENSMTPPNSADCRLTLPTRTAVQCCALDVICPVSPALPLACVNSIPETNVTVNTDCSTTIMKDDSNNGGSGCTSNPYILTRKFTVTVLQTGLVKTCEQVFTVVNDTKPLIVGVPTSINAECSSVPNAAVPIVQDACGSRITPNFKETIVAPTTSCSNNYSILRTWTASDACANTTVFTQTVSVKDTQKPEILNLPTSITVSCMESIPSPTVKDNCNNNPTIEYIDNLPPTSCDFSFTRVWTVKDECGNATSAAQTVSVKDTIAPVFQNAPSDVTLDLSCNEGIPNAAVLTATDNCNPTTSLGVNFTETTDVLGGDAKLITRTWSAIDECGNLGQHIQKVTVNRSIIANCPSNIEKTLVLCYHWFDPKVMILPSEQEAWLTHANNGVCIKWDLPTTTCADVSIVQSKGPTPCSTFAIGVHQIEYQAIGKDGTVLETCSFTVTIKPGPCPVVVGFENLNNNCPLKLYAVHEGKEVYAGFLPNFFAQGRYAYFRAFQGQVWRVREYGSEKLVKEITIEKCDAKQYFSLECAKTGQITSNSDRFSQIQNELSLYPNPTDGFIKIDISAFAQKKFTGIVYNTLGYEVMRFKGEGNQNILELDCTQLPSGMYNVYFSVDGQRPVSKSFVVQGL